MIPVELITYMMNIVHLPNPMFIMTVGDNLPMDLCSGTPFAISCIKYTKQDRVHVLEHLLTMQDNDLGSKSALKPVC